jgi:hypothetical protein
MSEAFIKGLDRDEARVPIPPEGPQCALADTEKVHRELKKVKFLKFLGSTYGTSIESRL